MSLIDRTSTKFSPGHDVTFKTDIRYKTDVSLARVSPPHERSETYYSFNTRYSLYPGRESINFEHAFAGLTYKAPSYDFSVPLIF